MGSRSGPPGAAVELNVALDQPTSTGSPSLILSSASIPPNALTSRAWMMALTVPDSAMSGSAIPNQYPPYLIM